jgi:uncharacterized protein (DUF58 family)
VTSADLDRAIRLIVVRSRREATGLFAGTYASAFRGGGLEFEESRPYVAGDDVRSIDWVTTARMGDPYVKCFREERNHTLIFGVDTSASMRFGTDGNHKAAFATRTISLLATAAARAGDRTGLVLFDEAVHTQIAAGRGRAHTWNLIRTAAGATAAPDGSTRLHAAVRAMRGFVSHRPTIILLSDFRDDRSGTTAGSIDAVRASLLELAARCDLIAIAITDPREAELPRAGTIRLEDPENPRHSFVLDTGSRRVRDRYRRAFAEWQHRTNQILRSSGAETLWLRSDRDPLLPLGRFFEERAKRRQRVRA